MNITTLKSSANESHWNTTDAVLTGTEDTTIGVSIAMTSLTTTISPDDGASDDGGISAEAIVGIVVGCAAYIAIMIAVIHIICVCTRRKKSVSTDQVPVFPDNNFYTTSQGDAYGRWKQSNHREGHKKGDYSPARREKAELRRSPVIGVDNVRSTHPDIKGGHGHRLPMKGDTRFDPPSDPPSREDSFKHFRY